VIVGVTLAPAIDRTARVGRLAFDTILRPTEVRVLPGGKGVNACRAAHRLGAQVVTTGVSGGHAGRWLVEALEREGLAPRFVTQAAETRTTYVTVDETGRSVLVYEPAPAVDPAAFTQLLGLLSDGLLGSGDWLLCAGSLPAGLADDAYALLAELAHAAGARCLVDAGGAALASALTTRPDVVKVSVTEARDALGASTYSSAPELARRLAGAGANLAVVTDGKRGAAAAEAGHTWVAIPPRVRAVNPIGAGDAFDAGLIVALAAGEATAQALVAATAAASASVLELGAGELDPPRAAELRGQVTLREVRRGTL